MKRFHQHPVFTRAGVLMFFYLLSAGPLPVHAQIIPVEPFATPPETAAAAPAADDPLENDPALAANTDAVKAVVKKAAATNPYLDTFLSLQRQNVLLAQLLQREKSLSDMVQNYKKMSIDYAPPKPDLKMCQELPANLSCAVAYPDRYSNFLPPPAPLPAVPIIPVSISTDDLPQPVQSLSRDAGLNDLMWTDITCLKNICRAVITPDPTDPAARYSVKEGDTLPPGGTVQSISSSGVTIRHKGATIVMDPAPMRPFELRGKASS